MEIDVLEALGDLSHQSMARPELFLASFCQSSRLA